MKHESIENVGVEEWKDFHKSDISPRSNIFPPTEKSSSISRRCKAPTSKFCYTRTTSAKQEPKCRAILFFEHFADISVAGELISTTRSLSIIDESLWLIRFAQGCPSGPGLLHLTIVSQTILHHEFHIISFKHELRRKRDSSQIHARSSEYGNISTLLTRFFSRVLTTVPGRTRAENRRNTRRMRLCP